MTKASDIVTRSIDSSCDSLDVWLPPTLCVSLNRPFGELARHNILPSHGGSEEISERPAGRGKEKKKRKREKKR